MSEDLIEEFLIETHENLDRLDRDLVELEDDPRNADTLGRVFRTIHTIKGACGFLAFSTLESISHVGESLLSKLRDGELRLNAEITTGLLALVDAIRHILAQIEDTGAEGDGDYADLIARLQRLDEGGESGSHAPGHADDRRNGDDRRINEDRRGTAADSSLRVDVVLLDRLMTLVGELVLARDQIFQLTATQTDTNIVGATQRLNLVASELQENVMKMRMQPIGSVWSKFPRIVRDLALRCHKQVRIEMEGSETELDKAVIQAIKDPLTHAVRNAVDHGIETPDVRARLGKAAEGHIRLRAFQARDYVNIEISDDGSGIDPTKIRSKAIQRGVVSAEKAAGMSDHDVLRLVFLPGLSTAEQVSNISGRGVGMDVVKTNIEKIGGQVDIQSQAGDGTTLRIEIPLMLTISPAPRVVGGTARRCPVSSRPIHQVTTANAD
jgi:two-component system chemotaxis sensor kinase CheA